MKWFLLWPLWAGFNILAAFAAWVLPLAAVDRLGPSDNNHAQLVEPRLPLWLSWFDTPDNSLLGDYGFQQAHPDGGYWAKVQWLRRNPACGFELGPLGAAIAPDDVVGGSGDPTVQDGPAGKEGFCKTTLGSYWNLVWVKRFPFGSRCFKLDVGWQLKTYKEDQSRIQSQPRARYAMSIRIPYFITE